MEARRKEHQKALARQKQEEGLARFAGEDGDQKAADKPVFRRFESYKKETQLPRDTASLKIFIDHKNESIILPMYGLAVPFHISTLKNVSKNDEGEYVYLRLNFITPGQSMGKKDDLVVSLSYFKLIISRLTPFIAAFRRSQRHIRQINDIP